MSLRNTKEVAEYIEDNQQYTNRNIEIFDIFEGNLLPYVKEIMRKTLSKEYYARIESRIYPINILRRVVDKLAQSYRKPVKRTASSNQDILEYYEDVFQFDEKMNDADEFTKLFKGYALKPFMHEGVPTLRVLPFDRFLTKSSDIVNPIKMTRFYEFIGNYTRMSSEGEDEQVDIWFIYEDEEFIIIDKEGKIISELMVDPATGEPLKGENPLGFIPMFYGNRSNYKILPTQDTDLVALSKLIPVQYSDISGAVMFQCFSIIYGIDVDDENLVMSPNAFWSIKSDPKSDKKPEVGTIKPEVDVDKVLNLTKTLFVAWMESLGVRVNGMSKVDGDNFASGISKVIDEMDTIDSIKKSIKQFIKDEKEFWQLLMKMHNKWVASGELKGFGLLPENWEVVTEFDEPRVELSRSEITEQAVKERDAGALSRRSMIQKINPKWTDEEIDAEMALIDAEV